MPQGVRFCSRTVTTGAKRQSRWQPAANMAGAGRSGALPTQMCGHVPQLHVSVIRRLLRQRQGRGRLLGRIKQQTSISCLSHLTTSKAPSWSALRPWARADGAHRLGHSIQLGVGHILGSIPLSMKCQFKGTTLILH